jgi:hypothetical protein
MMKLSQLLKILIIGNPADAAGPAYIKNGTINAAGIESVGAGGNDIIICNSAASTTATSQLKALKVWGGVWNDIADFQDLNDELVPGKCYVDTPAGAEICSERCQMAVIGLASDTFGFSVGSDERKKKQVPIAIGGWVLAYVDKEYPTGTPLTNDGYGFLTEMTLEEKRNYPERLVATYKKPETNSKFGPAGKEIEVNGRHWVKVK